MQCKVCGNESGKYPLCFSCNKRKEAGEIIKCSKCNCWHYATVTCQPSEAELKKLVSDNAPYLYEAKNALITQAETAFYTAIQNAIPPGYLVFPQINLAAFIRRTDDVHYHNELFRNVDFLITNGHYHPMIVIEINDQTHLTPDRKKRDEKVKQICEEAGIPVIPLWVSYGVNDSYIRNKITDTLHKLPQERIHHFIKGQQQSTKEQSLSESTSHSPTPETVFTSPPLADKKKGCYIATCVYGSYDCPPVWTLRRYRDAVLSKHLLGRLFIHVYYAISPTLIELFGHTKLFRSFFKRMLDPFIAYLQSKGLDSTPYRD